MSEPTPVEMLRPRRKIVGMSAILLPFTDEGAVDWDGFCEHVARTGDAGLTPAVNMDTGYVNLLDDATDRAVLGRTRDVLGGRSFVAAALGRDCPQFIAFELGTMFAPFGRTYDLETYEGLLGVGACIGAKHSSLSRALEWQRLELRDRIRPDFKVLTGNDLAIDMVVYGSDYLLGLSTFAPDLFARRDVLWVRGDPEFYELNDLLQFLGFFAFRSPVPAYKHSTAQFLKLRGWIHSSRTHPNAPSRPSSDIEVLRDIGARLGLVEV